ncbi:MAG: DUF1772 domain-containing protein [Luteitalea sp.]|nr:DUF1772 domain-containing protein [Luteitalea sp.]
MCLFLFIASLLRWQDPRATYWLIGSVLYLVGAVLVTMLFNVPRNSALAVLAPSNPAASNFWVGYLSTWTAWNHVRMIAALGAAVLFTVALCFRA